MPTMMKVPAGCGCVGIAGVEYTPDEHGAVEVPDGVDLAPLFDHGLTIYVAEPAQAPAGGGDDPERTALFDKAVDMGLKPHWNAGLAKLKAMIEEAEAADASEPAQAPAGE
jgi:hypothetical protein